MKTTRVNLFRIMLNNFTPAGQRANVEIIEHMSVNPKGVIYQKYLPNKTVALSYRVSPVENVVVDTFEVISARGVEAVKTMTLTKLEKGEPGRFLHVITKKFADKTGELSRILTKQRFIK